MNLTKLGPMVLPTSELIITAANMAARAVIGRERVKPYTPDFTTTFKHVCIHTGGW